MINKPSPSRSSTSRSRYFPARELIFPGLLMAMVLLFVPKPGGCQEDLNLKFIRLTERTGLKNRRVLDIFQDSYGFIWFATDYGFFRYDGYECRAYYTIPGDTGSISSNGAGLRAFQEDADGGLWVATLQGGLNKFLRRQEKFCQFGNSGGLPKELIPNQVMAILKDGTESLWIASLDKGLLHFDPARPGGLKRAYPEERVIDSLSASNTIISLCKDRMGRLWIGHTKGLVVFGLKNRQISHFQPGAHPDSLSGDFVTDIYQDRSGRIWVATSNGLNRWEESTQSFARYFPMKQSGAEDKNFNYIWKAFEDSHGNFWVGSNAGLFRMHVEDGSFERISYSPVNPFSISQGSVYAIMEDRSGNVWFGTNTGVSLLNLSAGLFNQPVFSPLQSKLPSISSDQGIIDILEVNGAFWIATQKGLFIFKPGQAPKQILAGDFSALYKDKNGRIYAGTVGNGFYIMDYKTCDVLSHFKREPKDPYSPGKLAGFRVFDFAEDQQGNIWIATNGSLNHFNPALGTFRHYYPKDDLPNQLSSSFCKALKLDKQGNLWIASQDGLHLLPKAELDKPFESSRNFIRYQHEPDNPNSISNNRVSAIFEDSRGRMWIGAEIGLSCYDPIHDKWERYFTSDGLPDNRIAAILEGDQGQLWIATAKNGLSRYIPSEGRFFNYTGKDGLNAELFNENACLKTTGGLLVFASQGGLNAFYPSEIAPASRQYPLYITGFEVYNKPVTIGGKDSILQEAIYLAKGISLPFRQKVFSFKVAALNFLNPEKQRYRYRLQNFDKEWRELGDSRMITFTNLFPRTYKLEVESTDSPQGWGRNSSRQMLRIHIRAPWWLRWWALLSYALLISSAVYGLFMFRVKQARQQAENKNLRNLDEFKNRMYAYIVHQFREPLAIILGLAAQFWGNISKGQEKNLGIIQENAQYLSGLVDQILDLSHVRSGTMSVRMAQGDIVLFLRYIFESFHSYAESKGINMSFEAEPGQYTMDHDPDKLRKIVSNLLSNALKFTAARGRVALTAREVQSTEPHRFEIVVSDNGIGIPENQLDQVFEPFRQIENQLTRQGVGSGIGLTLAKELVTLLGGSIRVQSTLGQGADFIVTLPVQRKARPVDAIDKDSIVDTIKKGIGMGFDRRHPQEKAPAPPSSSAGKPLLLLIEDNPNVRDYLSQHLKKEFHLLTATDGAQGLEMAAEKTPDIVISDVMMPKKDGFVLCRELRRNPTTSHIPVILLTARADLDSKIQGLQAGADDFLSKPVNLQELSIRLHNLLGLRQILQERYRFPDFWLGKTGASSPAPPPPRVSAEDEFLRKLQAVIEGNIKNPELDIRKLERQAGMSASKIHRKLKALTGMHTTKFVRHIRLTRASQLLCEDPGRTVSEVYGEVGFTSQSYFTKKFREVFGCTPKEYQEGYFEGRSSI